MSYAAYVALVGVSNLLIGFVLAIYMRGETTHPVYNGFESQDLANGGVSHSSCAPANSKSELNESAYAMGGEPALDRFESDSRLDPLSLSTTSNGAYSITELESSPIDTRAAHRSYNMDLLQGSWSDAATATLNLLDDFHTSLESVLRHIHDSGKELSPEECRQLFHEFQDASKNWLDGAELAANGLCAAIKQMPDSKNVSDRCERLIYEQVAQTETSVSNSLMLDWWTNPQQAGKLFVQELQRLINSCMELRAKLEQAVDFMSQSGRG